MNNLSNKTVSDVYEIQDCPICMEKLSTPIQLECGHIFDLDCIAHWFHRNKTCPLERKLINPVKVIYRSDLIKNVCATFNFNFTTNAKIEPIVVNINSPVHKLKAIIAATLFTYETDPLKAAFAPYKLEGIPSARNWFCKVILESGNLNLYSDSPLSKFTIKANQTYTVAVELKLNKFNIPCDHCYKIPIKEKICKHKE